MDWPIKETLLSRKCDGDAEGGRERLFCGINSYNIGRPLMQMIHFVWVYLRMAEELGLSLGDESRDTTIDMVLPTGAMGNLTGAYMAKQMGLPIGKLCCGVNINGKKETNTKQYAI
jgi:threonine synthase